MKKLSKLFQSIRMRSILLFLVCLLPIYSIGAGIFFWGESTIERQYKEAQANRIAFLADSLEADINRLLALQYGFFSDASLNRLTDTLNIMSNYDRDMCVIDVEDRLETIQASSRYVKSLTVLIPSIDRAISAASVSSLTAEHRLAIEQLSGSAAPVGYRLDGQLCLYISTYAGYNLLEPDIPKYALNTVLSSRELTLSLDSLLQESEEYICVGDGGDFLLSSLGSAEAGEFAKTLLAQGFGNGKSAGACELGGLAYHVRATRIEVLGLTYLSLLPEDVLYKPMALFLWLFALFSLSVLMVIFLFSHYIERSIHSPLIKLLAAFRKVKEGDFQTFIRHNSANEFSYIYDEFNSMTQQLEHLTGQVYKHQMLAQRAELRQLQAQINPHFLFNSFFILRRRIRDGDIDRSMEMANALGEYFQFITRTASSSVPLSEEVRHAHIYVQIQEARFSGRIQIEFEELPKEYGALMVERLILQPILENAFEHGLEGLRDGGRLRVSFHPAGRMLSILVEDNGNNVTPERLKEMQRLLETTVDELNDNEIEVTGILNIHRRIRYRMGPESGIYVRRSELGGLSTELRLLAQTGKEKGYV